MRKAKCHPEKNDFARGLCHNCYHKMRLTTDPVYETKYRTYEAKRNTARRKLREHIDKCPICLEIKNLCFDHDHFTNKFRGWICKECNFMLGLAKEHPMILLNAFKYLHQSIIEQDWHVV